jgi:SAM-dependent methyltransferase
MTAPALGGGVRLLEFGCGGGMNLIHLITFLEEQGIPVESAYGTDFSARMIDAARREAEIYLPKEQQKKVRFFVARNELLVSDLTITMSVEKESFLESFHLVVGVNTFRYCHRLRKEIDCAKDIFDLLIKGGICVMIDMNNKFPLFRSRFRDRRTMSKDEYYLPSLEEYARPFSAVGFHILQQGNFCWVPHSAGTTLVKLCSTITPLLNKFASRYAMRSLVISKKPV